MALSAVEELTEPDEAAEEAAEPAVEAMPKIGRAAFNYLEPRLGLDGRDMFRRCASCESYVPEAMMGGAVMGDRCARFGVDMKINDDASCNLYWPWHSGLPCEAVISFNAMELRKGLGSGPSPWSVGYKSECDAKCRTCRFMSVEVEDGKASSCCDAFESLNEKSPNLFDLVEEVNAYGGCSLWQKVDDGMSQF